VSDPVDVALRKLRLVVEADIAEKVVVVALALNQLVLVALVNTDEEPFRLEKVPVLLVRVVILPVVLFKLAMVVVASCDVPVALSVPTVKLDDEALVKLV
jgi:hypothetical protein